MNLANQSLGLSLSIIITELYAPSKYPCMCYPSTGRNEVDVVTEFHMALAGSQTLNVCQDSYGG